MVRADLGDFRHGIDVGGDYAVPQLADLERLCGRYDGAVYAVHQSGDAGGNGAPRPARLRFQPEPPAPDYVGQLRGVCVERAAELYFRLRQIRYARFGRRGLRTGDDGGVLVQRAGIVDLYRQGKILPPVRTDGKIRQTGFGGIQTDLENRYAHRTVLFFGSQRVFVYRVFDCALRRGLCGGAAGRHQFVGDSLYDSAKRRLGRDGAHRLFTRAARIFAGALYFGRIAGVGLDARRDYRAFFGIIPFAAGQHVQR